METYSEQDYRDVILAQQQTIDMMSKKLELLNKVDNRKINHNANSISEALNITKEGIEELEVMIRLWFYKQLSQSEMIEKIEKSPLPLREKLLACHLIGQAFAEFILTTGGKK